MSRGPSIGSTQCTQRTVMPPLRPLAVARGGRTLVATGTGLREGRNARLTPRLLASLLRMCAAAGSAGMRLSSRSDRKRLRCSQWVRGPRPSHPAQGQRAVDAPGGPTCHRERGRSRAAPGTTHADMVSESDGDDSRDKPFGLRGTFPGGGVEFSCTPATNRSGAVTGDRSGSGMTGPASDTCTSEAPDDAPPTLIQTTYGCIDSRQVSCRSMSSASTLTQYHRSCGTTLRPRAS